MACHPHLLYVNCMNSYESSCNSINYSISFYFYSTFNYVQGHKADLHKQQKSSAVIFLKYLKYLNDSLWLLNIFCINVSEVFYFFGTWAIAFCCKCESIFFDTILNKCILAKQTQEQFYTKSELLLFFLIGVHFKCMCQEVLLVCASIFNKCKDIS